MNGNFTQFVFFLSTAEDEAGMFVAQEMSFTPQSLRYRRKLTPGTYRVAGNDLEALQTSEEPIAAFPQLGGSRSDSEHWCTGWIDMA